MLPKYYGGEMFFTFFWGFGLIRYLICFVTQTFVIKCQYIYNKRSSHIFLININKFHLYINYSFYFYIILVLSILLLFFAYLFSITLFYLYYRGCWHRIYPEYIIEFFINSLIINWVKFLIHCPIFFTAAYGNCFLSILWLNC